jgi:hypothetical protein
VLHEISLSIVPAEFAGRHGATPFVAIVRSRDDFHRWLSDPCPGLQWLQVEGLLTDPDAWALAAHSATRVPIDVILSRPSEFSNLYRLVDVCAVRDVRVTMPATIGFLNGLKLAASLRLPVRVLPGQPTSEIVAELAEGLEFYLHEHMVEAPIEFYHSLLSSAFGVETGSLWMILEEDPGTFLGYDAHGNPTLPRSSRPLPPGTSFKAFVENHFENLIRQGAECASCQWQQVCRGYFKWPDRAYSCAGVKELFRTIDAASAEIEREIACGDTHPIG